MPVTRFAIAVAALCWSLAASADLYRWVDPETGSVKFSNIPPPWYGNEEKQRRAPKVERIQERARPVLIEPEDKPEPASAKPAPGALAGREARRKQLLPQMAASISNPEQLKKLLEEYTVLLAEMDKKDPKGAPARRAETEAALDKLTKGASK